MHDISNIQDVQLNKALITFTNFNNDNDNNINITLNAQS